MQAEPAKQKLLPPLTGIRGLTILWMVTFHLHPILVALLPGLSGFTSVTTGVKFRMDLLFMLSGFLISYVYIANRGALTLGTYGRFLRSRLIRLYPVYLAISALFCFRNGITSAASSLPFRIGLLVILGGFVIAYVLIAQRLEVALRVCGDFVSSRRIGRGLIVLVISLLLLGLGVMAMHPSVMLSNHRSWTSVLLRLAMVQVWPWVPQAGLVLGSVWFLSSLWFAYLFVFPIAWLLVQRLRSTWAAFLWVFVPIGVWLTVAQVPLLHELRMVTRASCGFLCGSALFILYARRSGFIAAAQRHLDKTVLVFLALSVLIPALHSEAAGRAINFLLLLGAPFLLAGNTAEASATSRFLAGRPMLWLGKISYSLFLSHEVSIMISEFVLPWSHFANASLLVRMVVVAAYVAFILAVAVALYRFVEAPWAAAFKRFSARRHREVATESPLGAVAAQSRLNEPGFPGNEPAAAAISPSQEWNKDSNCRTTVSKERPAGTGDCRRSADQLAAPKVPLLPRAGL